jgi:hypothetical protein
VASGSRKTFKNGARDMVHGVADGALRLISPYIRVRLESTLTGFAVHASPAIDDASHTAAHTLFHASPYTLNPIPWFYRWTS